MVSNDCETSGVRVVAEKSEVMLDTSGRDVTENEGRDPRICNPCCVTWSLILWQ
jgi:hypothetical protein